MARISFDGGLSFKESKECSLSEIETFRRFTRQIDERLLDALEMHLKIKAGYCWSRDPFLTEYVRDTLNDFNVDIVLDVSSEITLCVEPDGKHAREYAFDRFSDKYVSIKTEKEK